MEIKGKIESVSEAQTGTTKDGVEWAKRTLVLNDGVGEYPNKFVMTLFKKGEHIDYALDKFTHKVGDEVSIEYSARANEYKERWYGDNSIFRIDKVGVEAEPSNQKPEDSNNNLPF